MKTIRFGVVGNMGPEADALFQDIVAKKEIEHGALKDQDHMAMIVVKNSDIPDRSEAINEGGTDPLPELRKSAELLERCGVQFAVMTCNTAHYFRPALQQHTSVLLVDMLKATAEHIHQQNPEAVVGLLCTNGTYNSKIYDRYLAEANLVFVKPEAYAQEHYVHSAIYGEVTGEKTACGQDIRQTNGIKAGEFAGNAKLLSKAIEPLAEQGVTSIILGCTELPLVRDLLEQAYPQINFVDPMEVVAERVVEIYRGAEKKLEQAATGGKLAEPQQLESLEQMVDYVASLARG